MIDTMATSKAEEAHAAVSRVHPATDHRLDPLLSSLTGSDVVLIGTKADGSHYGPRLLTNVSFVPVGSAAVHAVGFDPSPGKGVRRFDLARVASLEAAGVVIDGATLTGVVSNALHGPTGVSEGGDL